MPVSVDNFVIPLLIAGAMGFQFAPSSAMAAEPLPLGFLDYLGSMVEFEDELVDPLSLQTMETAEQAAEPDVPVGNVSPDGDNAEEVQ